MGKFKVVGSPSLTLMEEMAEAIQVIAKKHRFNGQWNEIPDGKEKSRWEELEAEMADVFYQWFRLKDEVSGHLEIHSDWECGEGTLHSYNEECNCPDSSMYWDGE